MVAITEPVTACQNSKIIRETALADYYAMLAVLSQFPTEDLYSGLIDGSLRQDFLSIAAELSLETKSLTEPLSELASLKEDLETGASSMMKLRREYSRLFNNPDHPVIYLYEGVFIDEELRRAGKPDTGARLFVNPAALDAERCYRQAGLKRSAKINIPADSVSTKLEFMAYLYTARARYVLSGEKTRIEEIDVQIEEFQQMHIVRWTPQFFGRCVTESRHGLYSAMGKLGIALMAEMNL